MSDPLLVAIVGPTGSGKTALSLALGERFGGEIVSCDSVAVYREFEIGTAKPTPQERARLPHHLLDILSPDETITAGDYARRARQVLNEIKERGKLPIVVGGTGLYLRALLEGLFAGPARSEELRERLRRRDAAWLHRILSRLDPQLAAKIHQNDAPKMIRAIEVCLASRKKMSDLWQEGREPLRGFRVLRIGLDPSREALYERLNQRAQTMFDAGLIEETAGLMKKYPRAWALSAMGYKQAAQVVRGEVSREEAIAAAQQAHRNYAKRQMTWFRREPEVQWLRGFGDAGKIKDEAADVVSASRLR